MVSINVVVIVFASVVLTAVCVGKPWFHRHFRKPQRLRFGSAVVLAVVILINVAAFLLSLSGLWMNLIETATFCLLGALALIVYSMRTGAARMPHPRRVLAIGAHPDDLELACGGTLAKFVDSGYEVRGLIMSDGRKGGNADARSVDAERGASFIGLTSLVHHGFPDTELEHHMLAMVRAIEATIVVFNPDIILTHSSHDQHQDHKAVHEATLRAGRQHPSILCYESPSVTRKFNPTVFFDIDDYVDAKVQAVQMHTDQLGKPYMTPERVRGIAAFRGGQAKRKLAEGYEPVRLLGNEMEKL